MLPVLLADVLAHFFVMCLFICQEKEVIFPALELLLWWQIEILHLLLQPIPLVLCCAVSSWFMHEISFSSCSFYCRNALGFHSVSAVSPSVFSPFLHLTLSILVAHCGLLYLVITKELTFSCSVRKQEFLPSPPSSCLSFSMVEGIFTVFYTPHSLMFVGDSCARCKQGKVTVQTVSRCYFLNDWKWFKVKVPNRSSGTC